MRAIRCSDGPSVRLTVQATIVHGPSGRALEPADTCAEGIDEPDALGEPEA